ncbi:MAG TPA: Do family serine endopeptidase [Vicinamibacterales bacterium]|jgi:serine protease Do
MPKTFAFGAAMLATCVFSGGCGRTSAQQTTATASSERPAATTGRRDVTDAKPDRDDVVTTSLFRNIVKRENPVVVSITTQSRVRTPDTDEMFGGDEFFRRFFGAPQQPRERTQRALGSGFIISADGEILTNNHVVAGAEQIRVGLFNDERKTYNAKLVGRDPLTDSALIKLDNGPANLPVADLGDSNSLEPGDWVVAIGNPFRLGHTVTVGVVSYKARPFATTEGRFQNMLQTDASINPGNSGGPLIDAHGSVIGINSAILSGEGGEGNIGIGFAVPINTVKDLLPQLRQGRVHRARLGVQVQTPPITDDEAKTLGLPKPEGAVISMVEHDSPAERGGLRAGDVIVQYNGKDVTDGSQLTTIVAGTAANTKVPVTYYRDGKQQTTSVTVEELTLDDGQQDDHASSSRSPGFGISLGDLTPDIARQLRLPAGADGALVENVEPFTPAAEVGLTRGDVIIEVNHQAVHSASDASRALHQVKSGQIALVLLLRRGNQVFVEMHRE